MEIRRGTVVEPAISFQGVYKEYPFYQHIVTAGFKSFLFNLPKNIASLKKTRFMAVNGVSFDVRKGETFGIIGRNGSGKSTILGIIAGVIREDRGTVNTRGKISSLLELGAGFHPDLSGVENIILNGILMGHTKETVIAKMDSIIEFSELGDFIYQPLRTYSSGMQVRLGFSVAVHINPEILLVDEALAVGDMNFQEKCGRKMKEFKESGATIVMVSHDMAAITRLCDRALWIDGGNCMAVGSAKEVVMEYLLSMGQQRNFSADDGSDKAEEENSGKGGIPLFGVSVEVGTSVVDEQRAPAEIVEEKASSLGEERNRISPETATWWDSPEIVAECVSQITGRPEDSFYEFLARQYMIGPLEKGLSVCCRLQGIETNFMISKICRSFDVVDDEKTIERMLLGSWKGRGPYDFFLCIDFLHRLRSPDAVLKTIADSLRDGAIIVAIEYVGPTSYARSEKELRLADVLCALMGDRVRRQHARVPSSFPMGSQRLAEGAISPRDVVPALEKNFDVVDIRYFAGPLLDLVADRVLDWDIAEGGSGSAGIALLKNVIHLEQIMIMGRFLESQYSLIIAEKRPAASFHESASVH